MDTYTPYLIANALTLMFVGGQYAMGKFDGLKAFAGSIAALFVLACCIGDLHWLGSWTTTFIPPETITPLWANMLTVWFVFGAYAAFRYPGIGRTVGVLSMAMVAFIVSGNV